MALSSIPFAMQNQAHNADLFRQALSSLIPNTGGVVEVGDLLVTQTGTPSMGVQIAAGRAWVKGTEGGDLSGKTYGKQGLYFALNDAAVTKTITTANATNPRIDVAYIAVKDTQYSGVLDNIDFGIATGTPAASPVAPSVPANALALANIAVAANATSITNANITTLAGPIGGANLLTGAVPAVSNFTPSGYWYAIPFGARKLVIGQFQLVRTNSTLSVPGGGVSYTSIGTVAPSSMFAPVGTPSIQINAFLSGGGSSADLQCNFNPNTGFLQARGDGATVSWIVGAQVSLQVSYIA
ncbi:hypothetical protein SEA_SONALI_21 [Arthrobacter phage Sonali]|uniref:Minor tail protein n=1 Tax=Arthrobacter phage Sonali TaxID=2510495 RepID=A0A411CQY2_9CAUD|nr:virion structural protein [Arthrobacter phage Sonali]QAY16133.1 hypothetical protein SEA_SONALI_21 [Arthrobacter phage Sonali]